ncbi:MAG TPA: hypothetical protein VFB22_14725 [Candidatus Baltobacteraceae bacterium]|nr:hypothetical protein [Candidatus Baltobacteraceae bacterium]
MSLFAVVLAAVAAGCGGGGSAPAFRGGAPVPTAAPTLPPSSTASLAIGPAPASATFAPVAAAGIGGAVSASIGFPATTSGTGTLSMTLRGVPSPAPVLQSIRRRARDVGGSGITGIAYVTVTSSANATLGSTPTLTLSASGASSLPAGTQAYVAIYVPPSSPPFAGDAPPGTWTTLLGPVSIGGSVTTWTFQPATGDVTLSAGVTYTFGLFTATGAPITPGPTASPTPTPSPTPTATPKATNSPSPSPSPSPSITEYAAGPSSPQEGLAGITAGPDGALWFVEAGSAADQQAAVGRMTLAGAYTVYPIPTSDPLPYPWGSIAVGSDGNLWMPCCTSTGGQGMKRITTGGAMTDFETATASNFTTLSMPGTVSPGPDGALWFGQWCCNAEVGRMTTSGTVTPFPTGKSTDAEYTSSTFGSDKALWLVGIHQTGTGPVVIRVATNGTVTDYSAAAKAAGVVSPLIIAAGSDGALWFTDSGSNPNLCCGTIDRVTTSGSFTVHALGSNHEPHGITAGPDGAMWFTDWATNAIGRITASGAVGEYAGGMSANAEPNQIAAGPDKALWFTEIGTNKIGRLTVPGYTEASVPARGSRR